MEGKAVKDRETVVKRRKSMTFVFLTPTPGKAPSKADRQEPRNMRSFLGLKYDQQQ